MKKIILLLAVFLCCSSIYSQKKKAAKNASSSNVIANAANLTAALTPDKDTYRFEVKTDKKETLFVKQIDVKGNEKSAATKNNNIPVGCKITPFTAKGTPLYCITWTENKVTEAAEKTEDRTQIHSEIWNAVTKKRLLENVQTTTKIKEILWLDKLKNASQTSEKMRREGLVFSLTNEGDVALTGKNQENKLVYNPATDNYDNVKSNLMPITKSKKK